MPEYSVNIIAKNIIKSDVELLSEQNENRQGALFLLTTEIHKRVILHRVEHGNTENQLGDIKILHHLTLNFQPTRRIFIVENFTMCFIKSMKYFQ